MAVQSLSRSSITTMNKYSSMLAGNSAFYPGDFESISTVTVGAGGASSISFTSIPATYKHLQIRAISRDSRSDTGEQSVMMTFNSDTTNNYARHYLEGYGSTTASGATTTTNWIKLGNSATVYTTNIFGAYVVDILDYTNTSKYKTARSIGGVDLNGSGTVGLWSGVWMSTSAITSITITPTNSQTWRQYSHFALYGIKA